MGFKGVPLISYHVCPYFSRSATQVVLKGPLGEPKHQQGPHLYEDILFHKYPKKE